MLVQMTKKRKHQMRAARRSRPEAIPSPASTPKKPIDFEAIDALLARQRMAATPSVQLIRKMRDEKY
jgi:hypothetical protein